MKQALLLLCIAVAAFAASHATDAMSKHHEKHQAGKEHHTKHGFRHREHNVANISAKAIPIEHDPVEGPYNSSNPMWVLFKQCDSAWGSQQLGTCSLTICQAGCAMSSVAMMLATKGISTNPSNLNNWLKSNGGYVSGCDIIWSKADAFGKTSFQGLEKAGESAICSGLSAGHGIIANVNNGQHWVLLTGCQGNGVFSVNDPGYNRATYTLGDIVQEAVYH
eukprot:TRINITY_DN1070_c0_g1_i1.p2 TRINITY_DN1070_c0_g1~~TRINITY_DN1070_c0_g1_i1.p2  ORF type:complete len:221 (+),score=34.69 TRINITY_DN1070_c0_g1_i1:40-702(+)